MPKSNLRSLSFKPHLLNLQGFPGRGAYLDLTP